MQDIFRVGVIATTHGLKGEVKIFPTTDDINRFKKLKEVMVGTEKETTILEISHVKFFKNLVILGFKEINTIEDAMKLKGKELYVTRENAVKLEEGEYFISDLIGLKAVTEKGQELGELADILQTGANDVYIIKTPEGKDILLPAIKECILGIDLENKMITVHVLEGLLDL